MRKILIVVDMQNDFINGALGTDEAVSILPKVIEKVKDYDGEILFTRDTHKTDYLQTQEGKNLPIEHCIEETYGWQIQEDLKNTIEDSKQVFNKDTFGSKDLINRLIEENEIEKITEIELVGLCTDICVISNALSIKTFLPEVKISVDSSCCAGVTTESHNTALEAMKACQIEVR